MICLSLGCQWNDWFSGSFTGSSSPGCYTFCRGVGKVGIWCKWCYSKLIKQLFIWKSGVCCSMQQLFFSPQCSISSVYCSCFLPVMLTAVFYCQLKAFPPFCAHLWVLLLQKVAKYMLSYALVKLKDLIEVRWPLVYASQESGAPDYNSQLAAYVQFVICICLSLEYLQ